MNQELRDEFSELIRDRWILAITTFSFSPSTIILLLSNVSGRSYILFLSLYIIIILFIASNSLYIIFAQKKTMPVEIPGKPSSEKWVAKYPVLTTYARIGLILSVLLILAFIYIPPFNEPVNIYAKGTPTLVPSQTPTLTPSSTVTLTPTPKPISDSLYYMIVYDSSINMDETFHDQKKWLVARNMLVEIINGLHDRAQYGLVVIGDSNSSGNNDPCNNPAIPALTFSSKQVTYNYLGGLQPQGGGSFYKAYTVAKNKFEDLPNDTIRTLIYITGSSDTCETEDEWTALKNLISLPDSTFGIFSQIIILDDDGIRSRTLADQFNSLSNNNIDAQAPQSISEIQGNGVTMIHIVNNVTTYVNNIIATVATDAPILTPTRTATLRPGQTIIVPPTSTPTNTPTLSPTFTKTFTPSITPSPQPVCQSSSPSLNTASFGGSAWINTPTDCTTNITSGEAVPANGGYNNLPANAIIWVFVYPPNGPFYPQSPNACAGSPSPYPSQGGGGWSVPVYFGNPGDSSRPFDLVLMVTDQTGSDYIGQRLYEDCSNGFFDGISAGDLAALNITTKAVLTVQTR